MKIYAVALIVNQITGERGVITECRGGRGNDIQTVYDDALVECLRAFPPEDGYVDHRVSVAEIQTEWIEHSLRL